MRLGIVMLGTGAYAAANIGVMSALSSRGIVPYAVCGMHFGAWIAAQHLCGYDVHEMEEALRIAARAGKRLLPVRHSAGAMLGGRESAICEGTPLNRLLRAQTGERLLGLCERRGIFPCRVASSGQRVVFSSQPYAQGRDISLTLQATVSFACRAAMAQPPFLSPMPWLGSALLPEEDVSFAAGQLFCMGVDRVLIVEPRSAMAHEPDALELAASQRRWIMEEALPQGTGVLRIMMPLEASTLQFERMPRIAEAARAAAEAQLDSVLQGMGMAMCRVLPFRPRAQAFSRRS